MQDAATEDQSAVIALLTDPATHGGADAAALDLKRHDTHGAVVVLAGERAFKLKRAVRFPFLDYSTAVRRREACRRELALNRRTAPALYLAVRPILRGTDGRLRLGEPGQDGPEAVDWVVEMRRFGDDALLDTLAQRGELDRAMMLVLADKVAAFHRDAERRPDCAGHGDFGRVVEGVIAGLQSARDRLDAGKLAQVASGLRSRVSRHAALLDRRRDSGFVRLGHGDLHLRNVCLWQGEPTLFDAIEFDDRIAAGDVLYDLAFLLMDLEHRGLRALANAVFNRYMARVMADDGVDAVEGLALLPLFLACRAAIRAEVGLFGARAQADSARADQAVQEARAYLDLALAFLAPGPARLMAVGGLSGTGKSTLAFALAPGLGPAPGALVLRSDALRKSLLGRDLFQRLPPEGYAAAVTGRVFASLARAARLALDGGHAVVADAVYLSPSQRRQIAGVARAAGVAFDGVWLDAAPAQLERRVAGRAGDVSDATASIVQMQLQQDPGRIDWIRLDASGTPDRVASAARHALNLRDPGRREHIEG